MRLIELIRSLKRLASGKLKDPVFLSAGSLVRLKSPRTIHDPVIDCAMEANSARKAGLSSCKLGAYTLLKEKVVPSASKEKVAMREKEQSETETNAQRAASQAVRIPPAEPMAS